MCKYESFFPGCTTCIYKYLQSFYPPQKAHKSTHHGEIKQIWRLEQLSSHSTIRHIIAIVYFRKSTAEKAISNCARNEFWASTGTVWCTENFIFWMTFSWVIYSHHGWQGTFLEQQSKRHWKALPNVTKQSKRKYLARNWIPQSWMRELLRFAPDANVSWASSKICHSAVLHDVR